MKKTKKKFSKKWRSYVKTAELAVSVAAVSAVSDKKLLRPSKRKRFRINWKMIFRKP